MHDMFERGRNRNGNELITHCPQGHEYTEENTYMKPSAKRNPRRVCRTCDNAIQRRRYRKNKGGQ